ncbi:MAG: hypothetical protein ACRC06_17380 [Waterburya sp.]
MNLKYLRSGNNNFNNKIYQKIEVNLINKNYDERVNKIKKQIEIRDMDKNKIKDAAESMELKAESRSERIEGKIRENLGKFAGDQEAIEHGQEKQKKADSFKEEAEK